MFKDYYLCCATPDVWEALLLSITPPNSDDNLAAFGINTYEIGTIQEVDEETGEILSTKNGWHVNIRLDLGNPNLPATTTSIIEGALDVVLTEPKTPHVRWA